MQLSLMHMFARLVAEISMVEFLVSDPSWSLIMPKIMPDLPTSMLRAYMRRRT